MAETAPTTRFRFWLWLIRMFGVIVPRRLRADWRQEWEAELRHREALLAEWDRLDWRNKLGLLWRSTSAFWDALWMQPGRLEDEMFQDLRFGVRMLMKNPGFASVAVLTLALGIGINATIFSVVDGVLLRPLPYNNADQLVRIWSSNDQTAQRFLQTSYQDFQQFQRQSHAFLAMSAFSEAPRILRDEHGDPSSVTVARISDSFFPVFSFSPALGRDFLLEEYEHGNRVVMLSHHTWQSRYQGDAGILGKTITIDGEPHTVVGVMPSRHSYPRTADLWRPLTDNEKEDDDPELSIIARLAPGITLNQAEAEVSSIAQQIAQASTKDDHRTAWVQSMQAMVVREVRTPLLVLLGAVAMVLLIACTNVANLLLARGLAREQEIAIRTALGAGRLRIVRQLLTESLLTASLGGATGLLLGVFALKAIVVLSPNNIPRLNDVALDGRVTVVMVAVTLVAGFAFGLVPAFQASRLDPNSALKGASRTASGSISKRRLRNGLVAAEIALATVLVISAGLLLKSFRRLVSFDHGFRAENVLVVPIPLRGQIDPQFAAFYDRVLEQASALPGVESACLALRTPMESQGFEFPFRVEGHPALPQKEVLQAVIRPISSDYFRTVGIALVSGRAFNDQDRAVSPAVVIINQTFAKELFSNSEPVGQRLLSESMNGKSILVVGVAADVIPEAGAASRPAVYLPFGQLPVPGTSLLVRATDTPLSLVSAIRERIWALNPNVPLDKIYPLEQRVSEATTSPRFTSLLVGLFAALGLVLAAIGIYGVVSYSVSERTKEIGIRRALGAQESEVLRSIIRQGLTVSLLGLLAGLGIAVWGTRVMSAVLFGVSATDPLTFAGVASLMIAVAFLACYIPARRATKIDPLLALRHE
jgi:putative ABC transport system permease protein